MCNDKIYSTNFDQCHVCWCWKLIFRQFWSRWPSKIFNC